ncbi:ABC transporter substrate-binding protein [Candidatus Epulonipiscium viviparus]|uniref:ABC transporter substrate-binding protein n=1 Tax=Candidatus Epulonipiscium viviparus TaxID=420336 RepID=UPI0027381501|nr:ABC transporter substrate-binding protein [Candidatus Epulopiscium viviparus]
MKLKKYLLTFLIASMSIVGVGCSNSDQDNDAVTLKAHFIGTPPADQQLVEDAVNEYLLDNFGFGLEIVFTDFGDFNQKSAMIINTGEEYDIIFTCSWANDYQANVLKGAFLDLSPYLAMPEYQDLYTTINEGFWEGAKVNGSIYAVPTQKEIAMMPMYQFNKAYVEAANFDYQNVAKFSDLDPYLKFVKENYPDATPLLLSDQKIYRGEYDYVLGFDYPIAVDANGKVSYMYELPDIKDYIVTVRDFFLKGYVDPDAATSDGDMGSEAENWGVSIADGQPFAEVTWSIDIGFDVVTAPLAKPIVTTSSTRGAMHGININSEHPREALDFLQALNVDPKLHNLINYGIEDVHYTKVNDTQILRTEQGSSKYSVPSFAQGNLFNTYTLAGEPENKWEVFKKENDSAIRSNLLGFSVDTSNLKNEMAAINNLRVQYEPLLRTGSVDAEEGIQEYKDKLNQIGLQKVIDTIQTQVDEFLKK